MCMGYNGSQAELVRNGANARSIDATRRVASASRGVMPFQMPQTFSQLSQPMPLKNATCRSSVLTRFQRSQMFAICRDSSHLKRFTLGTNCAYFVESSSHQDRTFQPNASSP